MAAPDPGVRAALAPKTGPPRPPLQGHRASFEGTALSALEKTALGSLEEMGLGSCLS
jgi:hypothetical protein